MIDFITEDPRLRIIVEEMLVQIKDEGTPALSKVLASIESDPKSCSITLVYDDYDTIVGDWETGTIDVGDILRNPKESGLGTTQKTWLIHELTEQWAKQKYGATYEVAHRNSIKLESMMVPNQKKTEPNATSWVWTHIERILEIDGGREYETTTTTTIVEQIYATPRWNQGSSHCHPLERLMTK